MSTYMKDEAWMLADALASLYEQTRPPAQIVLVLDGAVSPQSEDIIKAFSKALNQGLRACHYDLVARMDSDDLCHLQRFEKQWAFFQENPQIGFLNTWAAEFSASPQKPDYIKAVPAKHDEIRHVLQRRNALCHPSIMVRKEAFERVGGYSTTVGLMEDYDLFIRMIEDGTRFASLQEALIFVRISPQQRIRRGGLSYVRKEWAFRWGLYRRSFTSFFTFLWVSVAMTLFRLGNPLIKKALYDLVRNKYHSFDK
jgi:GT2 family glycosyltransferase